MANILLSHITENANNTPTNNIESEMGSYFGNALQQCGATTGATRLAKSYSQPCRSTSQLYSDYFSWRWKGVQCKTKQTRKR